MKSVCPPSPSSHRRLRALWKFTQVPINPPVAEPSHFRSADDGVLELSVLHNRDPNRLERDVDGAVCQSGVVGRDDSDFFLG